MSKLRESMARSPSLNELIDSHIEDELGERVADVFTIEPQAERRRRCQRERGVFDAAFGEPDANLLGQHEIESAHELRRQAATENEVLVIGATIDDGPHGYSFFTAG